MVGEHDGWGEHQKLVLASLDRHNEWLVKIDEKLNGALLTFKLEKQMIEHLASIVSNLEQRVHDLENAGVEANAIEDYKEKRASDRRWIIGLSITSVIAIIGLILENLPA